MNYVAREHCSLTRLYMCKIAPAGGQASALALLSHDVLRQCENSPHYSGERWSSVQTKRYRRLFSCFILFTFGRLRFGEYYTAKKIILLSVICYQACYHFISWLAFVVKYDTFNKINIKHFFNGPLTVRRPTVKQKMYNILIKQWYIAHHKQDYF